ncbi:MAG: divergent polysaccharide deacetylase family protein [Pseudomonadota bacterium]
MKGQRARSVGRDGLYLVGSFFLFALFYGATTLAFVRGIPVAGPRGVDELALAETATPPPPAIRGGEVSLPVLGSLRPAVRVDPAERLAPPDVVPNVVPGKVKTTKSSPARSAPAKTENELTLVSAPVSGEPPKIIVIVDDMGLDPAVFERFRQLPGPVTFSFLPYANGVSKMVSAAKADGDAVMLHLPMEPTGDDDPGPNALTVDMSATEIKRALDWNLSRFSGYTAINNHMGSRFTQDFGRMGVVLNRLSNRNLLFLDSLTTAKSVASKVGTKTGTTVIVRDVFLDDDPTRADIRAQLNEVERLARENGYAVAICHPRQSTFDVLGPWLTSAVLRGFDLETIDYLVDRSRPAVMEASLNPNTGGGPGRETVADLAPSFRE